MSDAKRANARVGQVAVVVHEVVAGERPRADLHVRQRDSQRVHLHASGAVALENPPRALVVQVGHRGYHARQDLGLQTHGKHRRLCLVALIWLHSDRDHGSGVLMG